MDKLKPHIIKHTPGALPTFMQKTENNNNNNNNDDAEEIAQHPPGKKRFLQLNISPPNDYLVG